MRQSMVELYVHLVWATTRRAMLLTPVVDAGTYECLRDCAKQLGVTVLAANGMPDHEHLVVRLPATASVAVVVQRLKGVSSHFINEHYHGEDYFRWQRGYAALSLSSSHLQRVTCSVRDQKTRHAACHLWPACEEMPDPDDEANAD